MNTRTIFKHPMTALLIAGAVTLGAGSVSAQAQTVLRFATTLPEQSGIVKDYLQPWAEKINAEAEGELRIEVINGPTIANARNVYERVVTGVVDIAWGVHGGFPVPFPKTRVTTLPFTGFGDDTVGGSIALWKLYESGLLDDEYQDVKPLALVATPGAGLHSAEPIETLEDLSGLKVGVTGPEAAEILTELGASPVAVTVPELYQSMSTGVIDALATPYSGLVTFKLQEVTDEHLDVNLGGASGMIFMNQDAYEGLSDTAKAVLDANSGLVASRGFGEWFANFNNGAHEMMREAEGHNVNGLSEEETARWQEQTGAWVQNWIAEVPDGQAVFDTFNAEYAAAQTAQ